MDKVPNEMLPDAEGSTKERPVGVPPERSAPVSENTTEAPRISAESKTDERGFTREDIAAMVREDCPADASITTSDAPQSLARTLCSELVEVECQSLDGEVPIRTTANLEEIWHTGATLEMESPVNEGIPLMILRHPVRLAAKVLYCHQNLTGYSVGVQFAQGSCWTPDQFIPGHSLNLEELARSAGADDEWAAEEENRRAQSLESPERRLEEDLLRELPPSTRGLHRSGRAMLDDLSPLIARGSLVRLRAQMMPGKA